MALPCGCEIKGGMAVSNEMAQAHLKHTMEALLFWELLRRPSDDCSSEARLKLIQARIAAIEAIEELYPEAKSG